MARILIIDDEPELLEACRGLLESEGHVVATLQLATRAVEVAVELRPDLVILDLVMPDARGEEIIARLHDEPRTRSIPVVAMTGLLAAHSPDRIPGTVGFLAKPFDADTLLRIVAHALPPAVELQAPPPHM